MTSGAADDQLVFSLQVEVVDSSFVIGQHNINVTVIYNTVVEYDVTQVLDVRDGDVLQTDVVVSANLNCSSINSRLCFSLILHIMAGPLVYSSTSPTTAPLFDVDISVSLSLVLLVLGITNIWYYL